MKSKMNSQAFQLVWPILVALFYLLVTTIIKVLHNHFAKEMATHNLIRESRIRRNEYLASLESRASNATVE